MKESDNQVGDYNRITIYVGQEKRKSSGKDERNLG